jgi:multicomponent Na+:H+ antiporter subunit D
MQLLAFAVLAFIVLRRLRLYPPERRGVIIDVEWLYRMAGQMIAGVLGRQGTRAALAIESLSGRLAARVFDGASQVFAPHGRVARNLPLAGAAICTAALLGFVAIIAMFASR